MTGFSCPASHFPLASAQAGSILRGSLMKRLPLFLLCCASALSVAEEKPEPQPALEKEATDSDEPKFRKEKVEGWGTALDLAGDCKFAAKDNALVMTIPGGVSHDLSAELKSSTAPR